MRRHSLALLALLLAGCASLPEGLTPVQGFDSTRYLGRWYEIARLDHRFERGLSRVTAEYSANPSGGISVRNQGWREDRGEWSDALGRAEPIGDPGIGQFRVSFFRPFWSGYNIVLLDPDYRYVMVAGDNRSYFWVLARDPVLPPNVLQALVTQAAEFGFDTTRLIYVDQSPLR